MVLDDPCQLRVQPIVVLLLGTALRAMVVPGGKAMREYGVVVIPGVGVGLPRTPAVFPQQEKWFLMEREFWGGVPSGWVESYTGEVWGDGPAAWER